MSYLIDTNHASAFMADVQPITGRIVQDAQSGYRFHLCMPTVGELYYAVYASQRFADNMARLSGLLDTISVLPFDAAAAEEYGRIRAEQKAKGRPIPSTDAQIAAVARIRQLTVLTADRHFQHVDRLSAQSRL